ncbi:V-type ATPase, C subunit [Batrachochytrium salamandrivorans]|nr:V-type ATPase, C subunit [Batrachochytrium salamandrivorans]
MASNFSAEDVGSAVPAFFGFGGAALGLLVANLGAAYGMAKSGVGVSAMGQMNPEAVMKNIIPVVMAGVIGIYGLIVAVLIIAKVDKPVGGINVYNWDGAFKSLAAGLCVGFSGLGAGYAIGEVGDVGVRGVGREPRLFVSMILIMIFSEAIALFGLIVALVLST